MSKQVSAEERFRLVQAVYSAVNHHDKSKRKTVTQACKDVGLARSTYNRWKKLLDEKPEWVKTGVLPIQSRAPKRNGMALREEGVGVSGNAVRDNLERAGLYGYRTVVGSDGKPIKKKVIAR